MGNYKGILLLISSIVFFSVMATLVRLIPEINSTHTVFYRFVFNVAIMGILALLKVFPLTFVRSPVLLLRGLTGGIATFLFYLSIVKIGIGVGTVISYSYPVFAAVFSVVFLKEKISFLKWLVILVAFGGIVLISFSKINDAENLSIYLMLAIIGAVLAAASVTLVKTLHSTDNTYAIFFAQAIVGFWLFVTPATTVPVEISYTQFAILLGIGISAAAAQLIMTAAYKKVTVSTGSTFYMTVPVLNVVIGWMFFGEVLGVFEIIGAAIVITSCITIARMR